jgi:hypothetical protein
VYQYQLKIIALRAWAQSRNSRRYYDPDFDLMTSRSWSDVSI